MAKPLQSASIAAPGFFGLNTQESSVTLEDGFALIANNCIIDKYGRLGARKGWRYLTSGSTGVNLVGMHRFIDITGTETIISWSDTKFYKGVGTLTDITPSASQTDNTLTTGNWQCATLNDKAYFFQRGYKPMVYDPVADTITDLEDEQNATGTPPSANTVLSAYGRLFVADTTTDKMTVSFSDLLNPHHWNSGSAGSVNLESILVKGTDEIIGLGAQNGQLIVFCKRNIVVFDDIGGSSSFDPANLRLVEVISRVGCVARDSIQNTGLDIFFLSEDGLRSLGRVIQEKSLPMRDLSANVRDDIVQLTRSETKADIKSVYSEDNAFYLLLFPSFQQIYCFDTRAPLPNGTLRITIWDNQTQTNLLSLPNTVYFSQANGIADYETFTDNTTVYRMKYFTTYFDFGSASQFKILKRLSTTVIGGSGQDFVLKAGFDYTDSYQSYPAQIAPKEISEYGTAEYGLNNTVVAGSQGASTITVPDATATISAATQANPCSITATGHGFSTGDFITITDVVGMTELNGNEYTITVVDANTFTLDSTNSTAFTAYTSGGTATELVNYTVDFQTTEDATYNTPLKVWQDTNTYYYSTDDGTRTRVTLYTQSGDYSTEYELGTLVEVVRASTGGTGSVLQIGFEANINGAELSLQKLDIFVKQGRVF